MDRYKYFKGEKKGVLNILIHGGESSKGEWFVKDHYTKGGNFTEGLEKAGYSYLACDLYGHGDWKAEESDFDTDDISDEIWPKVVSESVDFVVETLHQLSDEGCTYNIITYSMGSIFGMKLLEALEGVAEFNKSSIGEIIFSSLCPEKEYDDEYSFHNNLELFKDRNVTVFYGAKDEDQDPDEIKEAFGLIDSAQKEIFEFDSGHSLPVEWVDIALRKILKL